MPDPESQQPQFLNLGSVVSKGEFGIGSQFFDEDDESTEPFLISADLLSTGRTCVIGSSGSGKSYTVGVICEELCKAKVPFVVIDVEGEYSGLKEKYEAIWVGDGDGCDLQWSRKVDLKRLAKFAPESPPIILDVSEAGRPREKVNEFLVYLYNEISRRRTPYLVILEEADRFSPQSGGERLAIIDEIARRGRKRGLGLMLCTQRPSLVDKNILSQCTNQMIGKLVIKNDLSSVAQFFSGSDPPTVLTTLRPGEFFALGGLAPEPTKVRMRARETRHGGTTPRLGGIEGNRSVERSLEAIQAVSSPPVPVEAEKAEATLVLPEQEARPAPLLSARKVTPDAPETVPDYEQVQVPEVVTLEEEPAKQTVELLPMEDFLDWDSKRKPDVVLGLIPLMEPESVPSLVRLAKSHKLFGQKENVTRVGLGFRPLVEVGVRTRSGVVKKKFTTKYFFIDGVTGKLVSITDRLGFRSGIENLLGLEESQIVILRALRPDRDQSLIEIAGASNTMEEEARNQLRRLEGRRLARSTRLGRAKMYRRLTDIPKISLLKRPLLKFNELDASSGFKLAKLKVDEDQVREVVKGMWKGADLVSFRQIYYPVYLAEVIHKSKKRYVWIDGRSGREIEF